MNKNTYSYFWFVMSITVLGKKHFKRVWTDLQIMLMTNDCTKPFTCTRNGMESIPFSWFTTSYCHFTRWHVSYTIQFTMIFESTIFIFTRCYCVTNNVYIPAFLIKFVHCASSQMLNYYFWRLLLHIPLFHFSKPF